VKLDEHKNTSQEKGTRDISHSTSSVKVLVIPTDEELEIAELIKTK